MIDRYRLFRRCCLGLLGLLLLSFGVIATPASSSDPWAPFDAPWFDRVGSSEGVPQSIITSIAQDQRGLVWVGTMVGLARYDGYRTQVFDTRNGSTPGLPDAYVRCLLALPDGGLLIGTNAGGLVRLDPATNRFLTYPIGANGTSDRKIYDLADDHAGGVWIATDAGLDHLDPRTNTITQLHTGADAAPRNFSVLQDRAGNVWLGNDKGLFVRRAGSTAFERPEPPAGTVATVLTNQIWALHEDSKGRLWVGSGQAGAVYLDTDGQWHPVPGFSGYRDGAQQSTVRDLLEITPNTMWIATDGSGVLAYTAGDTQLRQIKHDAAIASSLPGDSVRGLLQDRSGNIWVATDLGLARTDPNARAAFSLLPSPLEQNALSDTSVRGIYVDTRGRIWLGLGSGRIDMIDLKLGRMTHLQLGGNQLHRDVQTFVEAADGSILVGTQGLARIDPDTLAIQPSILQALENKPVLSLQRDGSRILIGTYDGLYRYDTRSGTLDHVEHDPGDSSSLASNTVRQIARVGDSWWYGTTRGISIANSTLDNNGFENLGHHGDEPSSLPQNYISSITLDPQERLWVSTFGGLGLIDHYSPGGPYRFRTIGVAQGLASDKISGVLDDDRGNLWISTSNGVSMIDHATQAVHNLGPRDGLRIPSYVYVGAARAPGGELLFGGLGGLTVIRPDWRAPAATAAPLAITHAIVNGDEVPFGELPHDGQTINLDSRSRNLRVDFALLDYQTPLETSYSYRMEGLDEGWTQIPRGALPSAIYTNLPHGDYRLRLRAETHGMQPHSIETSVGIKVKPRWYETVLSRFVALLLLIALVVLLVHLRTLYLRRQAVQLQRQIDEHTRDLLAANQRLDELAGTDGLTGVYNRRRFLELAGGEFELAKDRSICIALFDLDRFKRINDTHGHLAGDAVIRCAIEVIRQHCRQGDLVGRYGGEEFVLCLPDTSLSDALDTAERIRKELSTSVVAHDGHSIAVTVSIGVAALRPGESIEQWLSRADKALYEAKHDGRNRCVMAP
ncbi:ligand-binding sensor domain-containing diguanylate cyclase [Rhodanobacter sp. C03]|uniref:ligand-binding sensor domain-containing diguanylate cyclase n=1 Tax=Rhodanobacter sp. C03 TaxID=1945858 RepID=UPI0009878A17|nr:ligand-binding sensor domain-containing diguanylate cyclase [Rhodanobacter sp. C03]OOG56333.1 GGDEF domain-containing protein [Rhodanobacter sp. C03]